MTSTELSISKDYRPRLRNWLSSQPQEHQILIYDPRGVGGAVALSFPAYLIVTEMFDGTKTLLEIHEQVRQEFKKITFELETLISLTQVLDELLLLDGPAFQTLIHGSTRKPRCFGVYDSDPTRLRIQLDQLFTAPGGPGIPVIPDHTSSSNLRGVLVPHMDYIRGNVTYGWGFKELAERTDASLFVIIATSHYSPCRFTITRQDFETPFGIVKTDQQYIDRIVEVYGNGLFDDPIAHLPEHSVELEVVLLHYLFEKVRPIRIVPLVVGSFGDFIRDGILPDSNEEIQRMVMALREAEAQAGEPVCYVISGDLAHIGPKFGDDEPVKPTVLQHSRERDQAILTELSRANADCYFRLIAEEEDRRRICGLPPTYLTLQVTRPKSGRVLHYQQFVHPHGEESVSFASVAFEK